MNRAVIVSLVLVLAAGASGQHFEEEPVAVFVDFDRAYSTDAMKQMKQQAERLLKPLGFVLEWRLLAESRGTQTFPHLAVMQFRGACQGTTIPELEPRPWDALASSLINQHS